MRQYDAKNWSLNPDQFADLASSLSNFFAAQPITSDQFNGASAAAQHAGSASNGPVSGSLKNVNCIFVFVHQSSTCLNDVLVPNKMLNTVDMKHIDGAWIFRCQLFDS